MKGSRRVLRANSKLSPAIARRQRSPTGIGSTMDASGGLTAVNRAREDSIPVREPLQPRAREVSQLKGAEPNLSR